MQGQGERIGCPRAGERRHRICCCHMPTISKDHRDPRKFAGILRRRRRWHLPRPNNPNIVWLTRQWPMRGHEAAPRREQKGCEQWQGRHHDACFPCVSLLPEKPGFLFFYLRNPSLSVDHALLFCIYFLSLLLSVSVECISMPMALIMATFSQWDALQPSSL